MKVDFSTTCHVSEASSVWADGRLRDPLQVNRCLSVALWLQGMQAQNMMWGPTFVTIGMFIANIFVNWGLIKLYGFTGAAYAQSVSRVALLLFLIGTPFLTNDLLM